MIITTPLSDEIVIKLKSGDNVLLNGIIYSARDQAHERLVALIKDNKSLPFDLYGAVIYYVGPSPAKPSSVIGSAGPTTSYRMDTYTPLLLQHDLKGMIGKGKRSLEVLEAIKKIQSSVFCYCRWCRSAVI